MHINHTIEHLLFFFFFYFFKQSNMSEYNSMDWENDAGSLNDTECMQFIADEEPESSQGAQTNFSQGVQTDFSQGVQTCSSATLHIFINPHI